MVANKSSRNGDVIVGQSGQTGASGWSKRWYKLGVRARVWDGVHDDSMRGVIGDVNGMTSGGEPLDGLISAGETLSIGGRHEEGVCPDRR